MIDLGTVKPGSTIRIPFSSFDKDDGSSITMTNYAAADILIYKDGGTTERASTAGFTATTDFDTKTGKHLAIIDLADNTSAGFYSAGSEYLVAIDAVTVDAVTTGGWIARFRIGYPNAALDTTIATLATQTSFTLTNGPAEDDALNGFTMMAHDVASAIQSGMAYVLDYTGATKTVTLVAGPTFTMAAADNVSFFPPTQVFGVAGTAQTAGDIIGDTNDIQSRLPAALVGGRIDASVGALSGDATAADNAEAYFDGTGYAGTNNVIPTVTNLTNAPPDSAGITTLLGKLTGITLLRHWLGALAGKQAADATAQTEIRASGAGSGTYDPTTDSLEAIRDAGSSPGDVATAVRTELTTELGRMDAAVSSRLAAASISLSAGAVTVGTNNDKTGYRFSATGVDDVLDEVVLGSYTLRQLLRGLAAASLGKLSGAATTTITIRSADDAKDVVVATVDASGNRSAITLDLA